MPWDPAPPPITTPTVPSNVAKTEDSPVPSAGGLPPSALPSNYPTGPQIKSEPGLEPSFPRANGYGPEQIAAARAGNLMQQQYGARAEASSAAVYQQAGLPVPGQQRPVNMPVPSQGQQQRPPPQQVSYQQQQQQQQQRNALSASQTDGSGDTPETWDGIRAHARSGDKHGRVTVDGMIRAKIESDAAITDSGLMQPLDNLKSSKSKKRKMPGHRSTPVASSSTGPTIPQLDGGLDDDDALKKEEDKEEKPAVDDDVINSDLDDSEDEARDEAGDDENEGQILETILCTYDKVQRVKNKWKCTLKDGILATDNKEYLFHKANGEFEW